MSSVPPPPVLYNSGLVLSGTEPLSGPLLSQLLVVRLALLVLSVVGVLPVGGSRDRPLLGRIRFSKEISTASLLIFLSQ